jgi:hypothetical protein
MRDALLPPNNLMEIDMLKKMTLSMLALFALQGSVTLTQAQGTALTPSLKASSSYYVVTQADMRKCASPMCGGYFVKSVNQPLTRCSDGTFKKECHAFTLNTEALGWSDDQRALFNEQFASGKAVVRGKLAVGAVPMSDTIKGDVLTITEAWQGQALSKPTGVFYSVKSTGIVCITAPCPSLGATPLNVPLAKTTNPDLDLAASGAGEEALAAAGQALFDTGILTAGTIVPTKYVDFAGRTRRGTKLVASEFYLPAKP